MTERGFQTEHQAEIKPPFLSEEQWLSLKERGFAKLPLDLLESEGFKGLRKYARGSRYSYILGNETVFEVVDEDFQQRPVVAIYDRQMITRRRISHKEPDEDVQSFATSRIAHFSSRDYPVVYSSTHTFWLEPIVDLELENAS